MPLVLVLTRVRWRWSVLCPPYLHIFPKYDYPIPCSFGIYVSDWQWLCRRMLLIIWYFSSSWICLWFLFLWVCDGVGLCYAHQICIYSGVELFCAHPICTFSETIHTCTSAVHVVLDAALSSFLLNNNLFSPSSLPPPLLLCLRLPLSFGWLGVVGRTDE